MNTVSFPLLFSMPGPWEWLVILLVLLLLFGASRLPQIARGLGEGIKEFKKAISGQDKESDEKK